MDLLWPIDKQKFRRRLDELMGALPNLPAAFEILPQLLRLLDDPEADCSDLAEIIRIDPSLTAAVLRVSNSAWHRSEERTASLSEGISRLGLHEVYRIVLAIATAPGLKGADAAVLGRVDLWQHSLTTAVASQVLAERSNREHPEVVFSAGLSHDIGKTILVRAAREQYVELLQQCIDGNESMASGEREYFGTDHAEVAGWLLSGWKFPERIVAAVAGHHHPETVCKEHRTLAALVWAGNIVAYRLGVGNGYPAYVAAPDRDVLSMIGLQPENLGAYDKEILERLQREQDRL
jgi:putative nucleotidyltransferase with HDIG domain